MQVALGVAELRREPRDAVAVDDAVGDEAHRPADDVGAPVPLRGARRGVRAAALARAEPRRLRGGSGVLKKRTFARFGVRAGQLGRQ